MARSLQEVVDLVAGTTKKRLAVAVAQDEDVLQAVSNAYKMGLVDVSLVGDKKKIFEMADDINVDISNFDIVKEMDTQKAIRLAVDMVSSGSADVLMKGMVQTADLLRVVLDKDIGLRTKRTLSHIAVAELENYPKLLFITDGGMNIAPDLKQKADIIQNAVDAAIRIGIQTPKVAVLASIEMVNPSMSATLEAAALSKMAERGQIKNCIVDGPLAMDNAISKEAARHKGIVSPVAGDPDILLCPDIEAANILLKALVFLSKAKPCGILLGSRAPVVVTSRADDHVAKLHSIALAAAIARDNSLKGK